VNIHSVLKYQSVKELKNKLLQFRKQNLIQEKNNEHDDPNPKKGKRIYIII